ncbi:hypothetical protein TrCOL_g3225 [Triparma columacea]|uniref:Kinesin motor domain-containing protein n=1 Tax=Triparma columacea TaxID=722753 RepID=A0A9W7G2Z0_9STRA|nr:hypothetical protein TrCOL_g3225 [Triparma columacea]
MKVFVRFRPPPDPSSPSLLNLSFTSSPNSSSTLPDTLSVKLPSTHLPSHASTNINPRYTFQDGGILPLTSSQFPIYDAVLRSDVPSLFEGVNVTVLAYGQTGSGKTYTCTGGESYQERGLIPLALEDVYRLRERGGRGEVRVLVRFVEVYNECCYDLLEEGKRFKDVGEWEKLKLGTHEGGGSFIKGARTYECETERQALGFLFMGNVNRVVRETRMNKGSSRSHAIFTVEVECREGREIKSGRLNIVDLSGSERINKFARGRGGSMEETEGRNINLSLHHLQRVVLNLSGGGHVGWRDSMLTWLLKEDISGGGKAAFVGTIRMEKEWWGESGETLGFLGRCGKVQVKYKKNVFEEGEGFEVQLGLARRELDEVRGALEGERRAREGEGRAWEGERRGWLEEREGWERRVKELERGAKEREEGWMGREKEWGERFERLTREGRERVRGLEERVKGLEERLRAGGGGGGVQVEGGKVEGGKVEGWEGGGGGFDEFDGLEDGVGGSSDLANGAPDFEGAGTSTLLNTSEGSQGGYDGDKSMNNPDIRDERERGVVDTSGEGGEEKEKKHLSLRSMVKMRGMFRRKKKG